VVAFRVVGTDDEARAKTGSMTMVGDSLNVGVEPYLADALPGWRIATDDVVGRGSDDGIAALERFGSDLAPVVVVSLGTNDTQSDVDGFRADVREVLSHVGDRRCVVWATIWRRQANDPFNDVLADEARANQALELVEWDEMVTKHPEWLTRDGVHATPEGYAARAGAIADAASACLPAAA
jgi:lysophospholipase L1-like esterase